MFKEYKTIREVVGPLMVVDGVAGVTYNELVEIVNTNGETRLGKVLEVSGDKAVVQLFENSQGYRFRARKPAFWGTRSGLPFPAICWGGCSTAWAIPATAAKA